MPRGIPGSGRAAEKEELAQRMDGEQATQGAGESRMVRLECLRLANVTGRDPSEIVTRAKVFEAYVIDKPSA